MWLFLATEIMFFTGLIGSYIVLRAGSPATAYTNLYSAGHRPHRPMLKSEGVRSDIGRRRPREGRSPILKSEAGLTETRGGSTGSHRAPVDVAAQRTDAREGRGAREGSSWPPVARPRSSRSRRSTGRSPTTSSTNPLSIDLTACNTFILICSSVTMVLALGASRTARQAKCSAVPSGHGPDRLVLPRRSGL